MSCRGREPVIYAVPVNALGTLYHNEQVGLLQAAYAEHVRLHWNGPPDSGIEQQIHLLNEAVRQDPYGIAVDPDSLYASNGLIREALSKGVPVAVMDTMLPLAPSPKLSFVVEDPAESARLVVQRLRTNHEEHAEVILAGLDSTLPRGQERYSAMADALRRELPGVTVVEHISGPYVQRYYTAAFETALVAHPKVSVIVAMANVAAVAAMMDLQAMGWRESVRVIGYDQSYELLLFLRQGRLDALVAQNMLGIGRTAVENLVAARQGKPVKTVTVLPSRLVTRENIDSLEMQRMLQIGWEP